jgi:dienelactone hydrolase
MRIEVREPVASTVATPASPGQPEAVDGATALNAAVKAIQLALRAPAIAAETMAAGPQGPLKVAGAEHTERKPLRNAIVAALSTGLSLVHNAAASLVGGRRPDGVVNPELPTAQASAHLGSARLAMDVYNDEGAPPGFARVGKADLGRLGLDPAEFDHKRSGTCAALYRDEASGAFTLAFRGSESGDLHDIRTDWLQSNAVQALGTVPPSYQQAAKLTSAVAQALGGEVHLVGHSLGGGLANYAAVKNNLDFTVFNAAGLSRPTEASLADELAAFKGQGVVINDKYDPLTNLGGQEIDETFGGRHVGYTQLMFIDKPQGERPPSHLGIGGRIEAHSIDTHITGYLQSQIDGASA